MNKDIENNKTLDQEEITLIESDSESTYSIEDTWQEAIESDIALNQKRFEAINLKQFFSFLNENISVILFTISGLGALKQVFELVSIHLSYLKFFSVSQLVADGALVLFVIVTFSITSYIYLSVVTIGINSEGIPANTDPEQIKLTYFQTLYTSILTIVLGVFFLYFNEKIYYIEYPFTFLIFNAVFVAFIIFTNKKSRKYNTNVSRFSQASESKKNNLYYLTLINSIISTLVIIIIIFQTIIVYSEVLMRPYNIDNYSNVEKQVFKDYKDIKSYEILYFNDLYVFVEVTIYQENDKKVVIYKTEDVMF